MNYLKGLFKAVYCAAANFQLYSINRVSHDVANRIEQASEAYIDGEHRNPCPSFYVTTWHRLRSLASGIYIDGTQQDGISNALRKISDSLVNI